MVETPGFVQSVCHEPQQAVGQTGLR